MFKKILYKMIVLASLVSLVGCSTISGSLGGGAAGEVVQSDVSRDSEPQVDDTALDELVEGNTAFTIDLYHRLAGELEGKNLFYSPYSISLALAMTYAGARGETRDQMAEALHLTLPGEELHPAFNALDQRLESEEESGEGDDEEYGFQLNIANALWGQEGYDFLQEFLDLLARNYGAGMRLLDFSADPEAGRQTINDWVSDQTNEKIQNLLAQGTITPATRLVLTNAIYFKAAWQFQFEESNTEELPFTLLDGTEVQVPMMQQSEDFNYTAGDGYQAVELPYQGWDMSMVVLLPDGGNFGPFEQNLSTDVIGTVFEDLAERQVILKMPKFSFESGFSLVETLRALGMTAAFEPGQADFSGMDGTQSLFISEVVHKAFVDVNEKGTEAAAATAVVMTESAMPVEQEPVELTIDRPFLFLIRDRNSGTVLFIGRVLDPQ